MPPPKKKTPNSGCPSESPLVYLALQRRSRPPLEHIDKAAWHRGPSRHRSLPSHTSGKGYGNETMEEELSLNKDGWWRCNSNATQSQVWMVKISARCWFYFLILQCYNGQYHTCVGGSNCYHFTTQICQSTRHSCWHSLPNKCQVQTYFPQSCLPFPCERSLWLCTEQILDLCRETNSSH